jgi:hypothetical protein
MELLTLCINPRVYISRRALKHFVERSKGEILKNNNLDKTTNILISMVLYIENIIIKPDKIIVYELENKIIYEKIYNNENHLSIRVVTELVLSKTQIKSIHLIKTKIPP